ncbi:dnaJ homolog subfamily C member 28 [Musca autumnalis]|uniref:dnaJ homolog subfamily C member 28 n=1 Tax=Musca autumnalis TaxID=221902 RepID=UPI003CF9CB51
MFTKLFLIPRLGGSHLQQQMRQMHIKRADLYRKCCFILGVEESADQNTVRRAYIELVKKVHPDSGLPEASAERFQEVDEAFKVLQEKFAKNRRGIYEDDEEEVPDIRHTAPQHRQYLSFDGLGVGNPFQRQKQYQQIKAMKAQERVLKHRIDKSQADEKTVMKKGTFFKKHDIKTKYGFDRLVEDYIQEAMSRGDFNNLSCAGKPLTQAQTQNPYLDFTTHKLNKILIDNGFTPEWIMLQRDVREALEKLKNKMKQERIYYGEYPLNEAEENQWQEFLKNFSYEVQQINKNIDKYNLIVPIFDHQFFRVNLQKLGEKILKDSTLACNQKRPQSLSESSHNASSHGKSDFFSFIGSWF